MSPPVGVTPPRPPSPSALDPTQATFWDPRALETEERRVFEACHGCRMCFNYCGSFPTLFAAVDEHDGDVHRVDGATVDRVIDLCFQCKLCYVKCPYTPPHPWQIDFPRLLLRAKAVRARAQGIPRQDRMLGDPDALGRLGCLSAPLSNVALRVPANRALMEKVAGISRKRTLPRFARPTFHRWFARRPRATGTPGRRVAFFATCTVNWNAPDIGQAAVRVLERSGCAVECRPERCCGMPALDGGDVDTARARAAANVRSFAPLARAGVPIVVPGPTCSYTMKTEYPDLLGTEDARLVAAQVRDLGEYVMSLARENVLDRSFTRGAGRVALHVPCHLRAQNIGLQSAEMLRLLPDTTVEPIEQCAGIDGTWGMKAEFFDASQQVAGKLVRGIDRAQPTIVSTDCSLAALQIYDMTGARPLHPIQIVDACLPDASPESVAALAASAASTRRTPEAPA